MWKISFFILLLCCSKSYCQESFQIFNPKNTSAWLPVTYIINGSFDVIQNENWFNQDNFSEKSKKFLKRIENPHSSIKNDGGYLRFIQDEFFSKRTIPNIALHSLGGAYDALWLKEYFQYHRYKHPFLWAILVSYVARVGNEIMEASADQINSHDHIADLFFFDVAGLILASNKCFMSSLVNDFGMKAWHFQPIWNPSNQKFFNVGLNYIIRPKFLEIKNKIIPFVYFGMQNLAGISFKMPNEKVLSYANGIFFTDPLKNKGKFVTAIFYESSGELKTSLFINGSEGFKWRLNYYDLFPTKNLKVGFILGQTTKKVHTNSMALGLNISLPFGIGKK